MLSHSFLNLKFSHKNAIKKKRPNGQTGAYRSKMTRPDFYGMVDFIQNGRLRPAVSFFGPACDSLLPNKGDNEFCADRRRYSQAAIHDIRFAPVFSGGYLCDWICAGISGDDLYYRTRTGISGRLFIIADRRRCPGRRFMILDLRRYSGRRFIVTDLRRYLRRQFIKLEWRRYSIAAASGGMTKRQ